MKGLSDEQRMALADHLEKIAALDPEPEKWYRDLVAELGRSYQWLMKRLPGVGKEIDGHSIADILVDAEDALLKVRHIVRKHRRLFAYGESVRVDEFDAWLGGHLQIAPFLVELGKLPDPNVDAKRLREFYRRETGEEQRDSQHLVGMFELAGKMLEHHSYRNVFRFLARIAKYLDEIGSSGSTGLRAFCEKTADQVPGYDRKCLRRDWDEIAGESPTARQHYLCRVDREPTPESAPALYEYAIFRYLDELDVDRDRAGECDGAGRFGEVVVSPRSSHTAQQVEEGIEAVLLSMISPTPIADALDDRRRPVVELMLPAAKITDREYLKGADNWPLGRNGTQVENAVPVVVRPVEPRNGTRTALVRRWDQMIKNSDARSIVHIANQVNDAPRPEHVCVVADLDSKADLSAYLNTLFGDGIPLIVWKTGGGIDYGMISGSLLDMPVRLLKRRVSGSKNQHEGEVVLVWDNPHWVPENGRLRWR